MEKSVWKTIPVMTEASSMEDLMQILADNSYVLGYDAGLLCNGATESFSLPTCPVKIAILSRKDLELPINTSDREFYQKAIDSGYRLCSVEIGLLARLAYGHEEQCDNYSVDLWRIYIAMEPVVVKEVPMILRISVGTMGCRLDALPLREGWSIEEKSTNDIKWIEKSDKWIFVCP